MIKKIIFTFYILASLSGIATTRPYIDSIKQVLKQTNNTEEKLNCLYTLSYEYGYIDPVTGIRYGKECLSLAEKSNNLGFQLHAYNGIANSYETQSKYDSACYFHSLSYGIAKKMGVALKIAQTSFNVGLCYKELGQYGKALHHYLSAYRIFERDSVYNPRIHFYMSEMYMKLNNYEEAERQARIGIKKCREFNHNYIIYNMYINLAKCYIHKSRIDSAKGLLDSTLSGLLHHTDEISLAQCYNTYGEMYIKDKKFQLALENYRKELEIQKKLKNKSGELNAYLNMAYCASGLSSIPVSETRKYLSESEMLFSSVTTNDDLLLECYSKIAETFEKINDSENSYKYLKKYYELKDTILNKEKLKLVFELQTKYETEKKERQIALLKQNEIIQSLQIKKRNLIIAFSMAFIAVILFFAYFFNKKQKITARYEKELAIKKTEEKERIRIAKDIHDDLGSGLSKISFLSELISKNKNNIGEIQGNALSISETARKLVVNMRDLIWALDPENITLQGLIARIREYAADYLEDVSIELKLDIEKDLPESRITRESHREMLMVIKESLNNIVKHSKATMVHLKIVVISGELFISVKDNGIGLSKITSSGNGIKNMKNRIETLGGIFLVNGDEKGTTIEMKIKLASIMLS